MKKYQIITSLILIFSPCSAMDHEEKILSNSHQLEKQTTEPLLCFIGSEVLYLGEETWAKRNEKFYGQKFPLNTVFFDIEFKNLARSMKRPRYIPYELIKDKGEESSFELKLNEKKHTVICKKKTFADSSNRTLEDLIKTSYKDFLISPNFLLNDESSLTNAKVIVRESPEIANWFHGPNATPEALQFTNHSENYSL